MRRHSGKVASILLVGFAAVNSLACICLIIMPAAGAPHCNMGMPEHAASGMSVYHDCCAVTGAAETGLLDAALEAFAVVSALPAPASGFVTVLAPLSDSHSGLPVVPEAAPPVFLLTGSLLI